jgi:hypothetical protein
MTVNLVNGYVLISHLPDWGNPPALKRTWATEIAEALYGSETRNGMRAVARRSVTFTTGILSESLQERVRLEARLDAAHLSGLACAPLHGRGSVVALLAMGANQINLTSASWNWQAGDYAVLLQDDQTFDVQPVETVTNGGLTLNLAGELTYAWAAGVNCWPLLFGTLTSKKIQGVNGWLGSVEITIAETVSARSAQIGVLPAQPAGVGAQIVSKTNKIA